MLQSKLKSEVNKFYFQQRSKEIKFVKTKFYHNHSNRRSLKKEVKLSIATALFSLKYHEIRHFLIIS